MLKYLTVGAVALTVVGSTLAIAQPHRGMPGPARMFTAEQLSVFTDARIGALKGMLRLKPEQEANWPPVEAALRELLKTRADFRKVAQDDRDERDPMQQLRRRADALADMAAGVRKTLTAAEPLYRTFDDGQKQRLASILHMVEHRRRPPMPPFRGPGPHDAP